MNTNHTQRVEDMAKKAGETPHDFLTRVYGEERRITRTAARLHMDYYPLADLFSKYGVKRRKHGGCVKYDITPEQIIDRMDAGELLKNIAADVGCKPKSLSDLLFRYKKAQGIQRETYFDEPEKPKVRVRCLGPCDKYFMSESKFHRRCDDCKKDTEDIADDEPSRAYSAANVVFK